MSFTVGNRVRFSAEFRKDGAKGEPFDPKTVTATIFEGNRSTSFAIGQGLERRDIGAYSLDYTLDAAGTVIVRFESAGEGYQQQTYQVEAEDVGVMQPQLDARDWPEAAAYTPAYMAPEQPKIDEEDSEWTIDRTDVEPEREPGRSTMLAALRAANVRVDESQPTAFIRGIYDTTIGREVQPIRSAASTRRELARAINKGKSPHARFVAQRKGRRT